MSKDNSDSKLFAFLGVFLTVIGFVIVLLAKKKDKYALFYAKQGLVLFIAGILISVVMWASGWIPVVGWTLDWALRGIWIVLWIIGMVYSLSGKEQDIPLIGSYAKNIDI